MRLNKYIAHSGICSRRKAGDLVKAGAVKVNGEVHINPAYEVQKEDTVEFKGKILKPARKMIYILMNKPKNVVTTTSDEKARRTVMDIIQPKVTERIYPVGRLDRMTTGLLLLTNDGDLAKKLTHPSYGVVKRYHVILNKVVTEQHLKAIKKGLHLEDGVAQVDDVDWIIGSDNDEVGIEIHMGKNRIVRRIFESLGYTIVRLDRVYYAGLTKKDLPRGWFRPLKLKEIIMLKHFTGTDPAKNAEEEPVFESPKEEKPAKRKSSPYKKEDRPTQKKRPEERPKKRTVQPKKDWSRMKKSDPFKKESSPKRASSSPKKEERPKKEWKPMKGPAPSKPANKGWARKKRS